LGINSIPTWNCSEELCASGKPMEAMRQMRLEPSTPRRPSWNGEKAGLTGGCSHGISMGLEWEFEHGHIMGFAAGI